MSLMIEDSKDVGNAALTCKKVSKIYEINRKFSFVSLFKDIKKSSAKSQTFHALKDVSMFVPRGSVVGVLGRNGAGKSTLLRVLGGVYEPTSGVVNVNGSMVGLFELGGVGNPYLTGADYASRYLRIMGAASKQLPEFLQDILEFSELGSAFEQPVRTYSSGMQARLFFATATAMQHDIYLIDELLSVGDEHFQVKCWKRMRQRLLCGSSGVLVTHDWTAIVKLCEQANVIQDGIISFSGPSDKAVATYLDLSLPSAKSAGFAQCIPSVFSVDTGSSCHIELFVDIYEEISVEVSVSIEHLRIGVGWEIILIAEPVAVGNRPGRYKVLIKWKNLPLVPGDYSLNLFLTAGQNGACPKGTILDCRSWTYGNGLKIVVEGKPASTCVCLSYNARKIRRSERA